MATTHSRAALVLLALQAGLAVLTVLFHRAIIAEYGDLTTSALGNVLNAVRGHLGLGLALVVVVGVVAFVLASQRWVKLAAVGIPVLMLLIALAITPMALQDKLDQQYHASPQCQWLEEDGPGPGLDAALVSQRALDSIEHVGHFSDEGGTGVGGCDRRFVITDDTDALTHYRLALPAAGWQVVSDSDGRLRAERDDLAFEIALCTSRSGMVWSGEVTDTPRPGWDECAER